MNHTMKIGLGAGETLEKGIGDAGSSMKKLFGK